MRHELKYVITPVQYHLLKGRLQHFMNRDVNMGKGGSYFVRSIYYESINTNTLFDKENGVDSRKKYRIRYYDNCPHISFLECKSKKGTRVFKRRIPITEDELRLLLKEQIPPTWENVKDGICAELIMLIKTKWGVPSVVVDYLREAYTYDVSNVRITFDKELASGKLQGCLNQDRYLPNILSQGDMILEVKYDEVLPTHIGEILSSVGLVQTQASKFAMCIKKKLEGQIV